MLSIRGLIYVFCDVCKSTAHLCLRNLHMVSAVSALLVGLLLQHTLDTFVDFASHNLSDSSVLVAVK